MKMFTITEALICLVLAAYTWPAVESAFGDDIKREVFSEWSKYTHVHTLYICCCTVHTLDTYMHAHTSPLHTHCIYTTYTLLYTLQKITMASVNSYNLSTAKLCEVECTKLKCVGSEPL